MSAAILALDQRSATFCVPKTGRPVSVVTADLLLQIIFEGYDWILLEYSQNRKCDIPVPLDTSGYKNQTITGTWVALM